MFYYHLRMWKNELLTEEYHDKESWEGTHKAELKDNGKALINPMMGWTMHFYSNLLTNYGSKLDPEDVIEDFPGVSTVYLRIPWSFVEPEEGKFNWEVLDTPAQRWIQAGKKSLSVSQLPKTGCALVLLNGCSMQELWDMK